MTEDWDDADEPYWRERCTITVTLNASRGSHREEDWVKDIWPYMQPWFTRRRGVESGTIVLDESAVVVEWRYETNEAPTPALRRAFAQYKTLLAQGIVTEGQDPKGLGEAEGRVEPGPKDAP